MTNHLPDHPHAFLNKDGLVEYIFVFEDHNSELLDQVKEHYNSFEYKCCCDFGTAYVGGGFYSDNFYPVKPFNSWIRDEENVTWKAPVPYPNDGKTYRWDEETVLWIEVNVINNSLLNAVD